MKVTLVVIAAFFVLFSAIGNASQASVSTGPRFTTISGDELLVPNLSNVTLDCESTKPVEWTLPWLSHHFEHFRQRNVGDQVNITSSHVTNARDGYEYHSRLVLQNANYLYTGYFVCHHLNTTDFDDPAEAAKVYVYVEDEENLMVIPGKDELLTVFTHQSVREVIPCKPTSPSVKIALMHDEEGQLADSTGSNSGHSGTWKYDPREGFVTEEAQMSMNDYYTCVARLGDEKMQEIGISLNVLPSTIKAPKPRIDDPFATNVEVSQDFHLNCSAIVDLATTVELMWSAPGGNLTVQQRITTGSLAVYHALIGGTEMKIAYLVLYVRNVTKEDEGIYSCKATDHSGKSETATTFVKVQEEGVSYVNISNAGLEFDIETEANNSIKWVVSFEAHPLPEIFWFKMDHDHDEGETIELITIPSKFLVKNEANTATLQILNVTGADSGNYKLLVKTSKARDARTFILKVKDKPRVKAYPRRIFVRKNENFNFICEIESYPQAKVELAFRSCVPLVEPFGSEQGTTFELLEECSDEWLLLVNSTKQATISRQENEEKLSILEKDYRSQVIYVAGRSRIGGEYACNACNSIGCAEIYPHSLIKIGINELGSELMLSEVELKRSPDRDPYIGEQFNVSCTVSLYKFMPNLIWTRTLLDGNMQTLNQTSSTQGLRFPVIKTNYTYTETAVWDEISRSAEGSYSCLATNISNQTVTKTTRITVKSGQPPSNVQKTKIPNSKILVGSVIGSIILVALLALLTFAIRQNKEKHAFLTAHPLDMFSKNNSNMENINPSDEIPAVGDQAELLPYYDSNANSREIG